MREVVIHTDGASRGNPGPASIAYTIAGFGDETIEFAQKIGQTTNNQAEYQAMRSAVERAIELSQGERVYLRCFSDSELMIKQIKGEYRVRDISLRPHYQAIVSALRSSGGYSEFIAVRRENNRRADELANLVLDGRWQTE